MQSKYFNPAFNSAIFDGPVRIYFAQPFESQALKIYFMIQQKLESQMISAKEISKQLGANILVMLYPTSDCFLVSFKSDANRFSVESWNEDRIIGVNGPIEDSELEALVDLIGQVTQEWCQANRSLEISASL